MKKVAVIIINYNSSKYTVGCVQSIIRMTSQDLPYEIIVIDNNSRSDDFENLKAHLAPLQIKIISSPSNLGFSGANMLGTQYTHAKYLFFLNNDCILLNDNLSILSAYMESDPMAGICTGQMYSGDKVRQSSFNYFPTLKLKLFGSSLLRILSPEDYPKKNIAYRSPVKVPFVTGAAMFVDSIKFSEAGGFDSNYFLYCEEEEICRQMKKNNLNSYLVPDAGFVHYQGKSTVRNYTIEQEYYISLSYFFRKHFTNTEYILLRFFYFMKNLRKVFKDKMYAKLAFFILKGAPMKHSLRFKEQDL